MSKYKSSPDEQRAEANQNQNVLEKDSSTLHNSDGSKGVTIERIENHDVTVIHNYLTGQTHVENGIHKEK